jgi:hypothetical protein
MSARIRIIVHLTYTRIRLDLIGEDNREVELFGQFLQASKELVEFLEYTSTQVSSKASLVDGTALPSLREVSKVADLLPFRELSASRVVLT